jgi:hypothetical protein
MGSLVKEYRVFPTGDTFKPTETVNNIQNGTSVTVNDPGPFYEAPPQGSEADFCVYTRVFWNAGGEIKSGSSVNVTVQGNTVVTCWYQHGCSPGGGGNAITTFAFDVAQNQVLNGVTPIGSVTPASQWTPPSTSVTPSNQTITIDAKDTLSSTPFSKWMAFGSGAPTGDDMVIPPNGGGFYIAFYQVPKGGGGKWELGDIFDELFENVPDFDFDEVVDPSPLDKLRLAILVAKLNQQKAATPAASAGDSGQLQAQLARIRAELKRLEAREKSLSQQVEYIRR